MTKKGNQIFGQEESTSPAGENPDYAYAVESDQCLKVKEQNAEMLQEINRRSTELSRYKIARSFCVTVYCAGCFSTSSVDV